MTSRSGEPLPTSLPFDVFALNQALGRYLGEAMAGAPLTPAEYAIYSAIFEQEQVGPSELASRLGMPLTTVMDHLARFEGRGHVRRHRSPRDRRTTLVSLTGAGLEAHREANRAFEVAAAAIVAALPNGEGSARAALAVIRGAIEAATTASPVGAGRRSG